MTYTLEKKQRPYGARTRHDVLLELLKEMKITDMGEVGDCLVLPGKLRNITDGERKTSSVMKFKAHSDRDAMTVTYWRVK